MDRDPERGWGQGLNDLSERRTHRDESPRSWPMDFSRNLSAQLKWMQLLLDPDSGAILFRHPTLLCLDIQDPSGMARLLAEPVKGKLPIGV